MTNLLEKNPTLNIYLNIYLQHRKTPRVTLKYETSVIEKYPDCIFFCSFDCLFIKFL